MRRVPGALATAGAARARRPRRRGGAGGDRQRADRGLALEVAAYDVAYVLDELVRRVEADVLAEEDKYRWRAKRRALTAGALDCYCMGMVSIQSKRATWTRFSLQPSTNPGGQVRKPVEALLWTPPG